MKNKVIPLLSYLTFFVLFIILLETIGYVGLKLHSGSYNSDSLNDYENIRIMLGSNPFEQGVSKYISQPYLNYIPNPQYDGKSYIKILNSDDTDQYDTVKFNQHNAHGYRGALVPVKKQSKYRILCMGGSTTYGTGVYNPKNTYPAQLEKILNQWHKSGKLILAKNGVEVLNAGLEAGNSAEELMQYLFKYRYYKPDLTILHSGGNDALIDDNDIKFQPDYTHYKRLQFNVKPLPKKNRWLMKSNFISFLIIHLIYSDFGDIEQHFSRNKDQVFVKWFDHQLMSNDSSHYYHPFYQNHKKLIKSIGSDNSILLNLSFALNPNDEFVMTHPAYRERVDDFNKIIEECSRSNENVQFLAFEYDSIPKDYWLDDCHLNSKGERKKAEIIADKILSISHN